MKDYYGPNEKGRDFVVGDIHGYYDVLMEALREVEFDFENDRLFSCGDLVDRGPQNHLVLGLTREDWFIPVAGNHEEMMFDGMLGTDMYWRTHWAKGTGKWARRESHKDWGFSYGELVALVNELAKTMPTAIELTHANGKRYGIVHAAVYGKDWYRVNDDNTFSIWDRQMLYSGDETVIENIDYVFHGHTFIGTSQPLKIANRVYLDTSVYETGKFHIHEIGTEDEIEDDLLSKFLNENEDTA